MHYYRWRMHGDPNTVIERTRATCRVDGCTETAWAQAMCSKHLTRVKRHGSTDAPQAPERRFWAKVDKNGVPPPAPWRPVDGGCWLWLGSGLAEGYGHFFPVGARPNRRLVGAHRYAYELLIGPIAPGLHLDHLCRVPACVNPAHLEPVTPGENARRGREARKETTPNES